jgi:carbamoyl-phosphate synthase large subunit
VVNTTEGLQSLTDSYSIRRTALVSNISYYTTIAGALAAATAIGSAKSKVMQVTPLQAYA